jgi:hypothetical protein
MGNASVFGVYSQLDQAEAAIAEMKQEGFRKSDICILFPRAGSADSALELDNRGLEGASAGAACGAGLGSALGWLVGIGIVTIPSLDPYLGHGPIISLLSGAVVSAILGGLLGGLAGMGVSAYRGVRHKGRTEGGKILLSVRCDDGEWTRRARKVLERTGGRDIVGAPALESDFVRTDQDGLRST